MLMSDVMHWWHLPLSGQLAHALPVDTVWHGRLMVLAWVLLVPLCIGVARFFKITPKQPWPEELDSQFWWKIHLHGQSLAILITLLGLVLIWRDTLAESDLAAWHRNTGWTVIVCVFAQGCSGFFRGSKGGPTDVQMQGDHFQMSTRRVVFEYAHKSLGYFTVLLSWLAVVLGLMVADAPRWMLACITVWWLVFLVAFGWLQRQGRCTDTYQAIWGAAADLPGNQREPIGWGISRLSDKNEEQSV